jgi:uncharacterized protein (DUF2461 family)
MALLSFRGISTPSLKAQGEQRRSSLFNIPRDIRLLRSSPHVRFSARHRDARKAFARIRQITFASKTVSLSAENSFAVSGPWQCVKLSIEQAQLLEVTQGYADATPLRHTPRRRLGNMNFRGSAAINGRRPPEAARVTRC